MSDSMYLLRHEALKASTESGVRIVFISFSVSFRLSLFDEIAFGDSTEALEDFSIASSAISFSYARELSAL